MRRRTDRSGVRRVVFEHRGDHDLPDPTLSDAAEPVEKPVEYGFRQLGAEPSLRRVDCKMYLAELVELDQFEIEEAAVTVAGHGHHLELAVVHFHVHHAFGNAPGQNHLGHVVLQPQGRELACKAHEDLLVDGFVAVLHFFVDEVGKVVADSTQRTGATDGAF